MVVMKFFTYKELEKLYYIRIFGKDFYITKPVERMKKILANSSYYQIDSSWRKNGASKPLMDRLEFLSLSPEAWEFEYKRIWMIYANCLLEHGREKEAAQIIDKYLYKFPPNNIAYYLPVANWCYLNGYKDIPYLERANSIFNMLEENRKNNIFQNKLINAKRIAVVANGAGEVGKKKGSEIDDHDIVIRMNGPVIEGYEEDYGKKTDIWVRTFDMLFQWKYHLTEYAYGMFRDDMWHSTFPVSTFQTYSDKEVSYGYVDTAMKQAALTLVPHYYSYPTLGFLTMLVLYQILGSSEKVDCYGFAFLNPSGKYDYYYKDRIINTKPRNLHLDRMHNFQFEIDTLRRLYQK